MNYIYSSVLNITTTSQDHETVCGFGGGWVDEKLESREIVVIWSRKSLENKAILQGIF